MFIYEQYTFKNILFIIKDKYTICLVIEQFLPSLD